MGAVSLQSPPMEPPSPARLFAAAAGLALLALGLAGFFAGASFGAPGEVERALTLRVNGWLNLLHLLAGGIGLLAAGAAARAYALAAGALFTALGVAGLALESGDAILRLLPVGGADAALHLAVGLLGLAAAAATPRRTHRSEAGAQPVG